MKNELTGYKGKVYFYESEFGIMTCGVVKMDIDKYTLIGSVDVDVTFQDPKLSRKYILAKRINREEEAHALKMESLIKEFKSLGDSDE